MKVGLIARANDRGLGVQTLEAYKHYPFDRTLVVAKPDTKFPDDLGRFTKPTDKVVLLDVRTHRFDDREIKDWLRGLDVVFTVETLYDWRIADWARSLGVRTVVQGNPEFWVHRRKTAEVQPDVWAWPTPWRPFDDLPEGIPLPVPVPDGRQRIAADPDDGPLVVLHVAGHRALDDRNGTDGFVQALRRVRTHGKVVVRIVGQDGQLPEIPRLSHNITVELNPDGVADRWDLYEGVHVVILPRRYGGLCLPVLEAAASGCAIAMPAISPNVLWPIIRLDARKGRNLMTQAGLLSTFNTVPDAIAHTINMMSQHRDRLRHHQDEAFAWAQANTWSQLRGRYDEVFGGAL